MRGDRLIEICFWSGERRGGARRTAIEPGTPSPWGIPSPIWTRPLEGGQAANSQSVSFGDSVGVEPRKVYSTGRPSHSGVEQLKESRFLVRLEYKLRPLTECFVPREARIRGAVPASRTGPASGEKTLVRTGSPGRLKIWMIDSISEGNVGKLDGIQ